MEKQYAQAIFNIAHTKGADASEIMKQLTAHLKERGREKLLPRIGRELAHLQAQKVSLTEHLEVASEAEKARAVTQAKECGISAKPTINPSLISGWRAQTGSRIIDRSGKRALLDLYKTITTHT